uniref:RING-type domain-containing protein n=1 Tax=Oryza nivara TaxID=4536 RepID=A0A0E0GLK3_ORYNI
MSSCPSQFMLDTELWLLLSCRHVFYAACVDRWLRTTLIMLAMPLSCFHICRSPSSSPLEPRSTLGASESRWAMSATAARPQPSCGNNLPIYSLDSFEYHIDEEVEAIVSCAMPMSTKTAVL